MITYCYYCAEPIDHEKGEQFTHPCIVNEDRVMATKPTTKPKVDNIVQVETDVQTDNTTTMENSTMAEKPVTTMEPDDDKPKNQFVTDDTEEYSVDDVPIIPGERPAAQIVDGTLSLDQLNDLSFDDGRDEVERAKINPPTGDWEKEDRWKFEKRVNAADSVHGDIDPSGRTFLNIVGKPKQREANGISYEPTLFLRISPDIRYKQDKPNEVDMAYKLFLRAKDMYTEMHSEKPTKLGQLITMLEEDNYVLRTMNGDNGAVVVDVKMKRSRR